MNKAASPITKVEDIEKVKSFLMTQNLRNWFLFVFGINTGLRICDFLNMKVKDIKDKRYIELLEKKTGKSKKIYVNSSFREDIEFYTRGKHREEYLFPNQRKVKPGPLTYTAAYYILKKAGRAVLGTEISTHTMRKTFGSHYYYKTKDIVFLMKLFNHSSQQITLRYIGVEAEEMEKTLDDFYL
jgi:integrase